MLHTRAELHREAIGKSCCHLELHGFQVLFIGLVYGEPLSHERGHQPFTDGPKQLHIAGFLAERTQAGGSQRRILGQRAVRNVMLRKNSPLAKSQPGVRSDEVAVEVPRSSPQSIQSQYGSLMAQDVDLGKSAASRFMKSRMLVSGRAESVWVDVVPFAPPE